MDRFEIGGELVKFWYCICYIFGKHLVLQLLNILVWFWYFCWYIFGILFVCFGMLLVCFWYAFGNWFGNTYQHVYQYITNSGWPNSLVGFW